LLSVTASGGWQYLLTEKIGAPELLVGREQEFANFDQWTQAYATQQSGQTVLPAFLALGGFTAEALTFCTQAGIATAEQINCAWLAEP
jgi:hypothetical protein